MKILAMTDNQPKNDYSFDKKWSPAIAAHGHTALPNILLRNYKSLGITGPELRIIIALELHRWNDKEPWPSISTLAKLAGVSSRRARILVSSLHDKGIITRTLRDNAASTYNFDRLIFKLDQLAVSSLPPGRKQPPSWDETRLERRTKGSSDEYAAKQNSELKPSMNTGVEMVSTTLSRRYSREYFNDP